MKVTFFWSISYKLCYQEMEMVREKLKEKCICLRLIGDISRPTLIAQEVGHRTQITIQ
jgi:hypothetical protein